MGLLRRNLSKNPSAETGLANCTRYGHDTLGGVDSALTQSSAHATHGAESFHATLAGRAAVSAPFPGDQGPGPCGFRQTIDTTPGLTYTVSADVYVDSPGSARLLVDTGVSSAVITWPGSGRMSVTFVATSASHVVSFQCQGKGVSDL